MADQSSGGHVGLTLPAVTALLLVGWGIVSSATPLKSKRPSDWEGSPQPPTSGLQDVPARLWQDPLEAVRTAADARRAVKDSSRDRATRAAAATTTQPTTQQAAAESSSPGGNDKLELLKRELRSRKGQFALLAVSVQGQPYPEERENRIRTRHAILSGLSVLGLTPEETAFIGYFDYPTGKDSKVVVPFEMFKAPRRTLEDGEMPDGGSKGRFSDYEHVVVLWLDETQFSKRRLQFLRDLHSDLKRGPECKLVLIGPTGSTGLLDLFEEFSKWTTKRLTTTCSAQPWERPIIQVYSPWATMNRNRLALLLGDRIGKTEAENALSDLADPGNRVEFHQIIGNDKQLADLLFQELALRGACPRQTGHHTVVITEWDTDYGRSWKPLLETTLRNRSGICDAVGCSHRCNHKDSTGKLHYCTYLRGLDGRLPATATDKKDKESTKAPDPAEAEAPVGLGQVDYIRRLEKELLYLEDTWKGAECKDRGITAIGVLGSDLYDKLLILDALQKSFPRALFFTTDLDARYLEPRNYESVRNLLVASHFGLQLREDLQQSIPPFRDSYRTSVFLACLQALGDKSWKDRHPVCEAAPPLCQNRVKKSTSAPASGESTTRRGPARTQPVEWPRGLGEPRVFEIGRGVAYDLTGGAGLSAKNIKSRDDDPNLPSPREHYWLLQGWRRLWFILACIGFPLLLVPLSTTLQREVHTLLGRDRRAIRHGVYWLTFIGAAVVLLVIIRKGHLSPRGEPFSWFYGISVWPTAIIRLAAAVIAIFYLWAGYRRLHENQSALADEFDLPAKPDSSDDGLPPGSGIPALLRRLGIRWCAIWIMNWEFPGGQVSGQMLWAEYLRLGTRRSRIVRALIFGLLYFLFALSLFKMGDMPFTPYRGAWSLGVSMGILILCVTSLIFLTAIILDCTLLCDRLLTNLRGRRIQWPAKALTHYGLSLYKDAFVASELLKIRLVGEHTRVIGSFIYYPFIVLFLIIVARHPVFDRWDFPPALIAVFALNFLLAGTATWFLRRRAEDVRREAIDALQTRSFALHKPADVEQAIEIIRSTRLGSFGPLREDPLLRAVLIPFGGMGAIQLMELLSNLPAATG